MAGGKKSDLSAIFLLVAVLVALATALVMLWKPLKASSLGGKLVGLLGIACLTAAALVVIELGDVAGALSWLLPESWALTVREQPLGSVLVLMGFFLVLYLAGISMKRAEAPTGARIVRTLRTVAPARVEQVIRLIRTSLAAGRLDQDSVTTEIVSALDGALQEGGLDGTPENRTLAFTELVREAFGQALSEAEADHVITREEQTRLLAFADAFPDLFPRDQTEDLVRVSQAFADVSEGRLPVVDNPGLLMKYRGEKCHFLSRGVELRIEQTESLGYRGGSLGTTLHIGGLPLRIGAHGG